MNIKYDSCILTIVYNGVHDIQEVRFDNDGFCQIISKTNKVLSEFQTVCSPPYNHQYGVPISNDGKFIFIGNWEKGLFCYSVYNGNLVWKQKPGKVRNIITTSDMLLVEVCDKGIQKRAVDTGDLISEIKMKNIQFLHAISENEIFTGYIKNKYFIYEIPSLYEKYSISEAVLNPNKCFSFNILKSIKENGNLLIAGWEQYPNMNYQINGITNFERTIELKY